MLALNDIIVLSLLDHDDLVDTSLASSSDGSNVKSNIVAATTLTGATGRKGSLGSVSMLVLMVVVVSSVLGGTSIGLVEWESSPQVLALPVGSGC